MTRHHRKPKCLKGSSHDSNISLVGKKRHRAYHALFQHGNPHQVAKELNEVWIDPEFKLIVVRR